MLGTGSAFPRRSYNTCYVVDTGGGHILVDTGGGNGIISRLSDCHFEPSSIRHIILTHSHTDHILGAVWMVRLAVWKVVENMPSDILHIYGNRHTIDALLRICRLTFLPAYIDGIASAVCFHVISHGTVETIAGAQVRFIDCRSHGVVQHGFKATLPDGISLASLGDEALAEANIKDVSGVDYLICGAFCLYRDRDIFNPYKKHHRTVADVARMAAIARINNLILVHCEDRTPPNERQRAYAAEAGLYYSGNVIVPEDGDVIKLP